jgi:hypothetical protein
MIQEHSDQSSVTVLLANYFGDYNMDYILLRIGLVVPAAGLTVYLKMGFLESCLIICPTLLASCIISEKLKKLEEES